MNHSLPVPTGIADGSFARTPREARDERDLKWLASQPALLGYIHGDRTNKRAALSFFGKAACQRARRISTVLAALAPEVQSLLLDAYAPPASIAWWTRPLVLDTGLAFSWSNAFAKIVERRGASVCVDITGMPNTAADLALLESALEEALPAIRREIAAALRLYSRATAKRRSDRGSARGLSRRRTGSASS